MNRLSFLLTCLILACFVLGIVLMNQADISRQSIVTYNNPVTPHNPKPDTKTNASKRSVAVHTNPAILRIPALSIHAAIISVGLTKDGAMDMPKRADKIGWFAPGIFPGNAGNAVMAGHLDTVTEKHGIFWNLQNLQKGDDVYVSLTTGKELHFQVRQTVAFPNDPKPELMQEIFGASIGAHLNLITCTGLWQNSKKSYDKRLVVFTDLVE